MRPEPKKRIDTNAAERSRPGLNNAFAAISGGVGWSGGCVPAEWIPTAPSGGERYFYQDADHQMGLVILDDPGEWTRDELRDVIPRRRSAFQRPPGR